MINNWEELKSNALHYLCPPGNGVYTVNTGSDRKKSLHESMYGKQDPKSAWETNLAHIQDYKSALVLGICSDTGGGILRGAAWGPLFVRQTLCQDNPEVKWLDMGDVRVIPHLLHDKYLNQQTIEKCRMALYGDITIELPVAPLSIAEDYLTGLYQLDSNKKVFGIGGDHSCSYPLVKAFLHAKKAAGKKIGLIHFDAHTDLLKERLGIDICFGSWTAHVLDELDNPAQTVQIGIRSSGKDRNHWESSFGVNQIWAREVKGNSPKIAEEIVKHLKGLSVDELYVSFDIDVLDSKYASATGTPEPDGLEPHEAITIMKRLREEWPITGADMMEVAPFTRGSEDARVEPDTTLMNAGVISAFLLESLNR